MPLANGSNTPAGAGSGGLSGGGKSSGSTGTKVTSTLSPLGGKKQKMVNQAPAGPIGEVDQALNEDTRQRQLQGPALKVAGTVLGMMPAPGLGTVFGLGQLMGQGANTALRKQNMDNPGSVSVDKAHPGSVYSRINGMMYSTQADVPGYNVSGVNLGKKPGSSATDASPLPKKKAKTVLSAAPLGTLTNPQPLL